MLIASAIQYYWIYIEQIHYTRDLRTTAQNTILNTLGIVIGNLIKLSVSHNASIIQAPVFLLSEIYRGLFTFTINSTQVTSHRQV